MSGCQIAESIQFFARNEPDADIGPEPIAWPQLVRGHLQRAGDLIPERADLRFVKIVCGVELPIDLDIAERFAIGKGSTTPIATTPIEQCQRSTECNCECR
ncbi:hypothetical protein D7S65_13015 [Ralstonia insidiosa]|nr:hypothetical protein [Ralstonia insidiosa]